MKINFYYKKNNNSEETLRIFEERLGIIFPSKYRDFLKEYNGGILCKNKYHFLDIYGKNYCLKIRLLYSLNLIQKQIVDEEYDNYLYIGEAFNDYNNFISDDYLTINLLNGNICAYDQSVNHIVAKDFNEFLENIQYDEI